MRYRIERETAIKAAKKHGTYGVNNEELDILLSHVGRDREGFLQLGSGGDSAEFILFISKFEDKLGWQRCLPCMIYISKKYEVKETSLTLTYLLTYTHSHTNIGDTNQNQESRGTKRKKKSNTGTNYPVAGL